MSSLTADLCQLYYQCPSYDNTVGRGLLLVNSSLDWRVSVEVFAFNLLQNICYAFTVINPTVDVPVLLCNFNMNSKIPLQFALRIAGVSSKHC